MDQRTPTLKYINYYVVSWFINAKHSCLSRPEIDTLWMQPIIWSDGGISPPPPPPHTSSSVVFFIWAIHLIHQNLTHWGQVMHWWTRSTHGFRKWLVTYSAQRQYLNQCWLIVNSSLGNNFSEVLIETNIFESVVCVESRPVVSTSMSS